MVKAKGMKMVLNAEETIFGTGQKGVKFPVIYDVDEGSEIRRMKGDRS